MHLSFQVHNDSDDCCSHDSLGQHDLQANMYGCPWAARYSFLSHIPCTTLPTESFKKKKPHTDFHKHLICNELPPLWWTNLLPNPAAISYNITIMKPVMTYLHQTQALRVPNTEMLSNKPPDFHWELTHVRPIMHAIVKTCNIPVCLYKSCSSYL